MSKKISHSKYMDKLLDPETTDEWIIKHSLFVRGKSAFDVQVVPDPEKIAVPESVAEGGITPENAMSIGNGFDRWRRKNKFQRRIKAGEDLPIIVSEGDSWFQFPLLIKEVVDHLSEDFLIYSLGAAGDTADNMVFGPAGKGHREYMQALLRHKDRVQGFMFSAAGNDIIGENKEGDAALFDIIRPFNGNTTDTVGHINFDELSIRLKELKKAYHTVIRTIRKKSVFEFLPIFIHGYDYAFPFPWVEDTRDPSYAANNEWLGEPLDERGITDLNLRRDIIRKLIDELYSMLSHVASDPNNGPVFLVDCRGAMPELTDWCDEIHGTSDGFAKVADRFRKVMKSVIHNIS